MATGKSLLSLEVSLSLSFYFVQIVLKQTYKCQRALEIQGLWVEILCESLKSTQKPKVTGAFQDSAHPGYWKIGWFNKKKQYLNTFIYSVQGEIVIHPRLILKTKFGLSV